MKAMFCLPQASALVKFVLHNNPKLNSTIKLVAAHELERKTISHELVEILRFYFITNQLLNKIPQIIFFTKKSEHTLIFIQISYFP